MKDKRYEVLGVNSNFLWVESYKGTPTELLKETFDEKISYYLKGIAICLSKEELINELNKLKRNNMNNNIKLTITTFVILGITETPIIAIASTGVAQGNIIISCCLAYAFLVIGSFAFRIIKRIRDKFNW